MRWLADENFNNDIIRGLRRRHPEIDIVRVQDVGLSGLDDETILSWAAGAHRLLLTHDVTTITDFAYRRVMRGLPMTGVFEVRLGAPIGKLIDDLLLIELCSIENEWEGRIFYLPLQNRGEESKV